MRLWAMVAMGILKVFNSLSLFISRSYRNPIWIVATVLLGTSLTFLTTYYSSLPEETARFETAIAEHQLQEDENNRMENLDVELRSSSESDKIPTAKIDAILADICESQLPNDREPEFAEAYKLIIDVKRQNEILIAKRKGIHFHAPELNEMVQSDLSVLNAQLHLLDVYEKICKIYLAGERDGFIEEIEKTDPILKELEKEVETAEALQQSAFTSLESRRRTLAIENNRKQTLAVTNQYKATFKYLSLVFVGGYVLSIIIGVGRCWKNYDNLVASKPDSLPRTKKSRRKR